MFHKYFMQELTLVNVSCCRELLCALTMTVYRSWASLSRPVVPPIPSDMRSSSDFSSKTCTQGRQCEVDRGKICGRY